jgi:adenylosuccinate lyase
MAYKRNPMRAERMCGLARFIMGLPGMAADTAATQWFERTLDDSAPRRLYVPQAFLAADAVLRIALNLLTQKTGPDTFGLMVNVPVVARNVREYLPYMITENLMMAAVQAGGDRQVVHEVVREHSHAVTARVKEGIGTTAELLDRLQKTGAFGTVDFQAFAAQSPKDFVGRAPEQVAEFVAGHIAPVRARYAAVLGMKAELSV